jgi:drug/metabolite transporter (DMT)-like permease
VRGPFASPDPSRLMVALSWAAAIVACLGYGVASVLQSVGARRTAAVAGAGGLTAIVVQLPYLAGVGADVVAFAANVVALRELPLFLVQSVVTASVGVTAVVASIRGERLRGRDWGALAVLGLGLVLLCLTATAERAVRVPSSTQWLILLSVVVPLAVGLVGLRLTGTTSALVLAAAAGLAWSGVAAASRGLSSEVVGWDLLGRPLVWTVVVQGLLGGACFALALQRGSVTRVSAVTFMLEMVVPSLLGPWLFGDSVNPGLLPWAVLGFVLAAAGTVALVRYAE